MTENADLGAHAWLRPISGAEPAGKEARHEAEHEVVRAEIAKLGSLSGAPVDWQRLEVAASALLTHKSKDLVIATYLACALQERLELAGLGQGLRLLSGLIQTFGQAVYPLRTRARANALDWFVERTAQRLETSTGSLEQIEDLKLALRALDIAAQELLNEQSVALGRIRTALDRMALNAPAQEPTKEPATLPSHPYVVETPRVSTAQDAPSLAPLVVTHWLLPISDQSPAGSDASYSPSATLVRDELVKLETLAGEKPHWSRVFDACDQLLRTESKDLVVATQMTQALYALRGLEGLALGLTLVARIADEYWEGMWPPLSRLRRRANALSSLLERLTIQLSSAAIAIDDLPALERLDEAARALANTVDRRFGADAPSLVPLQAALNKLRETPPPQAPGTSTPSMSAPSAEQAPAPEGSAPPTAAAPAIAASPPSVSQSVLPVSEIVLPPVSQAPADASQIEAFLAATSGALVQAALALRTIDSASALACRLLRTGVWLKLEALPAADDQGKTRIPPPERRIQAALSGYLKAENWKAVLAQAENMLPKAVFWLDLQFYVARAHMGIGGAHERLAGIVQGEAQKLARRLPGFTQLRFSDGSPVACAETLAWLEPPLPPSAYARGVGDAADQSTLPDELRDAVLRSEVGAAASLDGLLASSSSRTSFLIRLQLGSACISKGALDSGIALLSGLEQELDTYQLERWEPELAQQVLKTLWSAMQSQRATTGVVHPEAARVCARLARLLPSALL